MLPQNPSRRAILRVGGAGLLGMTFPLFLAAAEKAKPKAKAKAVIFLHQWGGPGQHETFDPKPNAPDNVRGWYTKPIATKLPGLHINEKLPEIAKIADKITVVRCMQHATPMKNHNSAGYYALTGVVPPSDDIRLRDSIELFPAYGSIVSKFAPAEKGLASFVAFPHTISDGSQTPGQHATFLGKSHDPLLVTDNPNLDNFRLPELSLPEGITLERLGRRTDIMKLIDEQSDLLESSALARGVDENYQKAIAMLTSPKFKKAFDLADEKKEVRERYGRTTYGQSCLLARRVVEAGAKFVNVYYSKSIGGPGQGWDYHAFRNENPLDRLKELLPTTDLTYSALISDLDERGMLDSTMVVWVGEFGRTPKINSGGGRDHWPQCYSAVLAGGGVKRGFVYGKSDKLAAAPIEGRVTPEDLSATMFAALGLDAETEVKDALNRPHPISRGSVITEVMT
jgi:hypothetical protein